MNDELAPRRALRERMYAYERTAEQGSAARGCAIPLALAAVLWAAGLVAWWTVTR